MSKKKEKKPMTRFEKFKLNVKVVVFIVVVILIGFFAAYMVSTSLDDVIGNENTGVTSSNDTTRTYEIIPESEKE